MPIREDGLAAGFSIHRPPEADGFDRSDVQRLQALFPHLARACRLMRRTAQVGALATAGAAALDRLPAAIFILDRTGLPLFYNRAAQRVIDQADGLALSPRGFAAARPGEARQLRRAIGEASNGSADRTGIGATVAVSRPSGLRSYQVTVVPLGRAARHARFPVQSRAAAMVIVSDPETEPTLPEEALVRLFGFTPTEAQLAVRLAQGASPKEIAEATQRSPNTVRWMLRNVLAKTDCRRQIDLVRLLRSAALTLVLEDGSPDETGV